MSRQEAVCQQACGTAASLLAHCFLSGKRRRQGNCSLAQDFLLKEFLEYSCKNSSTTSFFLDIAGQTVYNEHIIIVPHSSTKQGSSTGKVSRRVITVQAKKL